MGIFNFLKKNKDIKNNSNFSDFYKFLSLQKSVKPNKEKLEELKKHYTSIAEDKNPFVNFINLLGVDFFKYKDTLQDINITDLSWLQFLASKNEVILLDSKEDTFEHIKKLQNYKNGFFANLGKEYKKDFERLNLAKDITYFLRDILSDLCPLFDLIYIHTEDKNKFFIAYILQKNISRVLKLAESLKIKIVRIHSWYPNKNEYEDKFKTGNYGITQEIKEIYNKERNEKYINPLKARKIEELNKAINRVLSIEDEEKYSKLAQIVYNDIAKYGLLTLNEKKPEIEIENFVVNVIKILLANKLIKKQELIDLEISEGFFFHWIEDGNDLYATNIINDLLNKIEEM